MSTSKKVSVTVKQVNNSKNKTVSSAAVGPSLVELVVVDGRLEPDTRDTNPGVTNDATK